MSQRILTLALLLGGGLTLGAAPADRADNLQVHRLIEQLGSALYRDREQATEALAGIGAPALEALRQAAASEDAEVRRRAGALVEKIEKAVETARLLAPGRVRLVYKDTPVTEAVADLARKTGYDIRLAGDARELAGRKVTLDTGETTFWEAFDRFCREAGLAEAAPSNPYQKAFLDANVAPMPALPRVAAVQPQQARVAAVARLAQVQRAAQIQGVRMMAYPSNPWEVPNQLLLTDGKPSSLPSHYAGALRIRALSNPTEAAGTLRQAGEIGVALEVTPEPRLQWRHVLAVRIQRAVDEKGQELAQASELNTPEDQELILMANMVAKMRSSGAIYSPASLRQVPIRLRKGEQESARLAELTGTLAAQMQTAQAPLITMPEVLKAAGKTVKGEQGGLLKVEEVSRKEDGEITLRLRLDVPPEVTAAAIPAVNVNPGNAAKLQALQARQVAVAAQLQMQLKMAQMGAPVVAQSGFSGLTLLDAKGQTVPLMQAQVNPQGEYVLTFRPRPDQAEADKLVFSGSRTVMVEVPFTLKDVPVR